MITGLNHITLAVTNLDRSFAFYTETLRCQPLARWPQGAYLLAGDMWLCLSLDANTRKAPLLEYTHLAFSLAPDTLGNWAEALARAAVPQWKDNTSEGESFYILDPDGHKLELHIGDWRSRLAATKLRPYKDMEFFF